MTDPRLISVIIPVFNNVHGLRKCLSGIALQSYPRERFEVIIVDNASHPPLDKDSAGPGEFRIVACDKPGAYAARNTGSSCARGDILAFIDADCVPAQDWLSEGVAALLAGKGRNIVGGEVVFSEPPVRTGTALYQSAIGFQQGSNIQEKGFSATANLFCTPSQMTAVGPFDENLLSGGDRDWCWRAAARGFTLIFEPRAIVSTLPRIRLMDAIRQARRVAAGRAYLRTHGTFPRQGLQRYRTLGQSIAWVKSQQDFTFREKLRIIVAGAAIRTAAEIEAIRLRLGGTAERR